MKKLWILGCLSLALVGCQSKTEEFTPHIRGEILTLSQTGNISGLYVESIDDSSEVKAASVTLTKETDLLDDSNKTIKFEALEIGMIVDIELDGEILETYPVQGTAKIVRLVSSDATTESTESESTTASETDEESETSEETSTTTQVDDSEEVLNEEATK